MSQSTSPKSSTASAAQRKKSTEKLIDQQVQRLQKELSGVLAFQEHITQGVLTQHLQTLSEPQNSHTTLAFWDAHMSSALSTFIDQVALFSPKHPKLCQQFMSRALFELIQNQSKLQEQTQTELIEIDAVLNKKTSLSLSNVTKIIKDPQWLAQMYPSQELTAQMIGAQLEQLLQPNSPSPQTSTTAAIDLFALLTSYRQHVTQQASEYHQTYQKLIQTLLTHTSSLTLEQNLLAFSEKYSQKSIHMLTSVLKAQPLSESFISSCVQQERFDVLTSLDLDPNVYWQKHPAGHTLFTRSLEKPNVLELAHKRYGPYHNGQLPLQTNIWNTLSTPPTFTSVFPKMAFFIQVFDKSPPTQPEFNFQQFYALTLLYKYGRSLASSKNEPALIDNTLKRCLDQLQLHPQRADSTLCLTLTQHYMHKCNSALVRQAFLKDISPLMTDPKINAVSLGFVAHYLIHKNNYVTQSDLQAFTPLLHNLVHKLQNSDDPSAFFTNTPPASTTPKSNSKKLELFEQEPTVFQMLLQLGIRTRILPTDPKLKDYFSALEHLTDHYIAHHPKAVDHIQKTFNTLFDSTRKHATKGAWQAWLETHLLKHHLQQHMSAQPLALTTKPSAAPRL